ncbi:MAG: TauD/TfdA family dioxygenase [Gallionellaceae bacterium]|jgi:taurine dioxygenase|nr:TauD/TfdA family dioxygenase [Gallionellaceae bacterium]
MTTSAAQTPVDSIEVQALSPAIGARVLGVDASQALAPEVVNKLLDAWHASGVLYLPGQTLDEAQQVRFGQHFGELAATNAEYQISKSHPSIMYITNEKENGKYIGALPDGEMYFHSDTCYVEKPSKATMLYAMNVPKQGGNTLFANMYLAYEKLPADVRARIDGRRAINSYEPGGSAPTAATRMRDAGPAGSPGRREYSHPMVSTHPVTGRKSLYINRLMTEYIEGMPRAESDELLDYLFNFQERPEFVYEHRWTPGDLLMWDNRCTLHARTDFDAGELRKMRRITVKGDGIA